MDHSRAPMPSHWRKPHLNPPPQDEGTGVAGLLLPEVVGHNHPNSATAGRAALSRARISYTGESGCGVYSVCHGLSCSWPSPQLMQKFISGSTVMGESIFLI